MSHQISRRRFLGTTAAAGAGALATQTGTAAAAPARRSVDVVVVGGGFAGLAAAYDLMRAGRSVLVLEADDQVGGRVRNEPIGCGEITERGGTFAGPTQNKVLALAKDMGVGTFPTYADGDNVYYADGERTTYSLWPGMRWQRGGPVAVVGPGVLIAHGHALREAAGRIHWAGTESSTFWAGYMDGAVRSGQRAADEVVGAP